jgi:hypothetical protein
MKKLFFLLIAFALVLSCSSDETSTPAPAPIVKYTITLSAGEGGTVSTTGGEYEVGQIVSVTATPQGEYLFKDWSDGNTNATRTITVSSNNTFTANFEKRKYALTLNFEGEGEVIEEIVNAGRSTDYDSGTTVKLTAQAAAEWAFVGWTGDIESTEESVQILIGEPKEVTATFEKKKYPLTVNIEGEGEVLEEIVNAGRTTDYNSGTTVKLTAQATDGWKFLEWRGDIESTDNPIQILISESKTVTATFEKETYQAVLSFDGFHSYVGYSLKSSIENYGVGVTFYTAAWSLINSPLLNFQVGMPGTWITPNNRDNTTLPLCPVGTYARDNWDERGPTYQDVFQTLEGGVGYWAGNKFRNGSPKFSMNATPNCYTSQVASPGWGFFGSENTLGYNNSNNLGIAQISNRLLIPPDGITFDGSPNGEFLGYGYMALPFTNSYNDSNPVGDQSWTCFLSSENFKGPIAYYLPETWSRLSKNYPAINGRGLDSKPGIIGSGAMEVAMVPLYSSRDSLGTIFTKIPKLNFPVNENGFAAILQDVTVYNKSAIYNEILNWKNNDVLFDGRFLEIGSFKPGITPFEYPYKQGGKVISGLDNYVKGVVQNSNVFGLEFNASAGYNTGSFPEYYKESQGEMTPVLKADLPLETGLGNLEFQEQDQQATDVYRAQLSDPYWNDTTSGPYSALLNDGSTVTYYWYRFIDQPVFKQFNWSDEKKQELQNFIVKIHKEWTIDKNYMAPPSTGKLVRIYDELIVTPPPGLEYGYVPIVTSQN